MEGKGFLWLAYKFKFYFDTGVAQVSWFTGKLPELMALVYLLEKFGVSLGKQGIMLTAVLGTILLYGLGFAIKFFGLYDVQQVVTASKDPVQREIYLAAKRINKGEKL